MIQIKKLPLSKLQKMDTRSMVKNVVQLVETYNPEALLLRDMHKILLDQQEKVKAFTTPYGEHPKTAEMKRLHRKRLKYASSIHMQVRAFEKMDEEETEQMARIAKKMTKKYLTYLGRKNCRVVENQIWDFFLELENSYNQEVREAFIGLDLQPTLDELEETNMTYRKLSILRENDIKNRPPTGGIAIQRKAQAVLRMFFEQVNSYQETFDEIDYSPLINELNVMLTKYSKLIKTRIATNKRRAKKKAATAKAALEAKDGVVATEKMKEKGKGKKKVAVTMKVKRVEG